MSGVAHVFTNVYIYVCYALLLFYVIMSASSCAWMAHIVIITTLIFTRMKNICEYLRRRACM